MTKPQARQFLFDFVQALQYKGTPLSQIEDNFDLCLGLEDPYEAEAYALVPEAYPHIIAVIYDTW